MLPAAGRPVGLSLDGRAAAAGVAAPALTEPLQPGSAGGRFRRGQAAGGGDEALGLVGGRRRRDAGAAGGSQLDDLAERVGEGEGAGERGRGLGDGGAEAGVAGGERRRAAGGDGGAAGGRCGATGVRRADRVDGQRAGDVADRVVAAGEAGGGQRVAADGVAAPGARKAQPAAEVGLGFAEDEAVVAGGEAPGRARRRRRETSLAVTVSGAGSTVRVPGTKVMA